MDNVNKVVLIAGALLIALIVVSIGVFVTYSGNKVSGDEQLEAIKAVNHNNKFAKYNTTGITGAQVKECISLAIANNRNAESVDFTVAVTCGGVFVPASTNPGGVANASTIDNASIFTGTIATRANGTISSITFH